MKIVRVRCPMSLKPYRLYYPYRSIRNYFHELTMFAAHMFPENIFSKSSQVFKDGDKVVTMT